MKKKKEDLTDFDVEKAISVLEKDMTDNHVRFKRENKEDYINLERETLTALIQNGKTIEDVKCVIYGNKFRTTIEQFLEVAKNIDYDNSYGLSIEINQNIKIIGEDWIMVRNEYDGFEWWDFININTKLIQKPITKKNILPSIVIDLDDEQSKSMTLEEFKEWLEGVKDGT